MLEVTYAPEWVRGPQICPGGEIGRRKGLKIPRPEMAVPVRVRPRVLLLYRGIEQR